MMKSSLLVFFALLGLASASLQDIVKQSSEDRAVSNLDPELQDRVPLVGGNDTVVPDTPSHTEFEDQQDQDMEHTAFMFQDNVNLKWQTWPGYVPSGAVGIYNGYARRTEYVCKSGCHAGFYSPSLDRYCHYPYGGKEYRVSHFQILVNKDNFEVLWWKDGSNGGVPSYSVQTCSGIDIYVGKNQYGLGKVHSRHRAFFLPWGGKEYWYRSYQVLAINRNDYDQKIFDVRYSLNGAQIFRPPPEILKMSPAINNDCQNLVQTVTLSKTRQKEMTWNIGHESTLSISNSITAQIPFIGSAGIELSATETRQFSRGTTLTESSTHSVDAQITVPPNHSCNVRMMGRKMRANIPYTARLRRTYTNGAVRTTSISGTYYGVQMGEIKTERDRCEPVANARPCP